jgi:hypothetical protein
VTLSLRLILPPARWSGLERGVELPSEFFLILVTITLIRLAKALVNIGKHAAMIPALGSTYIQMVLRKIVSKIHSEQTRLQSCLWASLRDRSSEFTGDVDAARAVLAAQALRKVSLFDYFRTIFGIIPYIKPNPNDPETRIFWKTPM